MIENTESKAGLFSKTNWFEQYFWPFGCTSRAEFGRGWLMVVIGQLFMVITGLGFLMAKTVLLGILLVFAGLFVGSWMIGILHIRRLHDRGRSGWLAFFVYIPVLVAVMAMLAPQKPVRSGAGVAEVSAQSRSKTAENEQKSKAISKRQARQSITPQTAKGRKGRRAMRSGGGGGNKKPPNIPLMKTGVSVVAFSILAFLFSFVSLGIFQRMHGQSSKGRWSKSG